MSLIENNKGDGREWLWPLLLIALIFTASGRSEVAAPDVPRIDKVAHFFVYGLLSTLIARVPQIVRLRPLGIYSAVVLASLYGISDEWHQSFTPGRSVELFDWFMDTAGAVVAVTVYAHWPRYRSLLEAPLAVRSRVEMPAGAASDSSQ